MFIFSTESITVYATRTLVFDYPELSKSIIVLKGTMGIFDPTDPLRIETSQQDYLAHKEDDGLNESRDNEPARLTITWEKVISVQWVENDTSEVAVLNSWKENEVRIQYLAVR